MSESQPPDDRVQPQRVDRDPPVSAQIVRRAGVRARHRGWRNSDVLRTASLVIGMYLLVQLVSFAHLLFLVAFLGVLFGLAVSAGVDLLGRWRVPRGVGAAAIVIGFFGLLVGFGAWMAPTIHEQSVELRRRLPDAIDRVEAWVNARRNGLIGIVFSSFATEARADSAATMRQPGANPAAPGGGAGAARPDSISLPGTLRDRAGAQLSGATRYLFPFLSSTAEVIAGFLIIVFLSIYIAVVLRKWLVTQLIAMVTLGLVTTVILVAMRVKAALALGLLAGVLEFIPTIGPIISSVPAIAMGFLDSPEKALWVLLAYVLVHFMESHMLIPLLMKGGINLPPALTVFSQALMALLFGFLGLMCAVPILAATMVAVKMLYVEGVVGEPQTEPGDAGPVEEPPPGIE